MPYVWPKCTGDIRAMATRRGFPPTGYRRRDGRHRIANSEERKGYKTTIFFLAKSFYNSILCPDKILARILFVLDSP